MKISELLQRPGSLKSLLEGLTEVSGPAKRADDIKVCGYLVQPHWRRRAQRLKRKNNIIRLQQRS